MDINDLTLTDNASERGVVTEIAIATATAVVVTAATFVTMYAIGFAAAKIQARIEKKNTPNLTVVK